MRIVSNPSANLTARQIARYDVCVLPLKVTGGSQTNEVNESTTFEDIDRWVNASREHPCILGTSAADFIEVFRKLAHQDREIIVLIGSRKISGSFKAAVSAARTLKTLPGYEDVQVEVVDSAATDISLGFCVILAGESARAGRSFADTVEVVKRFAEQGVFLFVPTTLDWLVKGGRASFVRAFIADMLKLSPIIGFKDGELAPLGKVSRKDDVTVAIADNVVAKIGAGRAVWCCVGHARQPEEARRLTKRLKERLAIVHLEERLISTTSYLSGGQTVAAFVNPVDRLPWTPPIPPRA